MNHLSYLAAFVDSHEDVMNLALFLEKKKCRRRPVLVFITSINMLFKFNIVLPDLKFTIHYSKIHQTVLIQTMPKIYDICSFSTHSS